MLMDAFWVLTDWNYKFDNFWQNSWERDYGIDVREVQYGPCWVHYETGSTMEQFQKSI
jgi:hypothetical protein